MKKILTIICLLSISFTVNAQESDEGISLVFKHDRLRTENAERALLNKAIGRLAEQKNKTATGVNNVTLPDTVYLRTTDNEVCRVFMMDSINQEFTKINCELPKSSTADSNQLEGGFALVVEYDRLRTENAEKALLNKAIGRLAKQEGKIADSAKSILLPDTVYLRTTDGEVCRVFMMDSINQEFTKINCEK